MKPLLGSFAVLALFCFDGSAKADFLYALDNFGDGMYSVNASDVDEPRDNWFANVFTARADANRITRVDFVSGQTALAGKVVIYKDTDGDGDPATGAPTRLLTKDFTPRGTLTLNWVTLDTPVDLEVGDKFIVAVFMANVSARSGPYDTDTSAFYVPGAYWARTDPGLFDLDDLSGARRLDQELSPGGWVPSPPNNCIPIRALGVPVPEPSTLALAELAGLGFVAVLWRRRKA